MASVIRHQIEVTFAVSFGLLLAMLFVPVVLSAQAAGNNAIYASSGTISPSDAYVDVSVFDGIIYGGVHDLCADIYQAFLSFQTSTTPMLVIDARGVPPLTSGGQHYACSASPWTPYSGSPVSGGVVPSVVLLPAGIIDMNSSWVIPDRTRIIGEGADPTGSGYGTVLVPQSTAASPVLQFGSSTVCPSFAGCSSTRYTCNGIGVEDLSLNASGLAVTGIQNMNSEERTYINRVSLENFGGVGLSVGTTGAGQNSGPYSNITFSGTGSNAQCAQINGSGPTRGIHGITCNCNPAGSCASAGILLQATGNTIEDVSISGFAESIQVTYYTDAAGNPQVVEGNHLLNISGAGGTEYSGNDVVKISGRYGSGSSTKYYVQDLTLLQVANAGEMTHTILDDETPSGTATSTTIPDSQVAIYAIGLPGNSGYGGSSANGGTARFTTASHAATVPTWLVGYGAPASNTTCSITGALYSNTASSGDSLYGCVNTPSRGLVWQNLD